MAKRRKKSAAARLRPFWTLIGFALAGAIAGGFYAATWPGFYPKRLIVSGNRVVSSQDIAAKAAIAAHQNMWLQSMRASTARIETIPYVKSARIYRALPATIRITVTERTAFARVKSGGRSVLVDEELRVLPISNAPASLPFLIVKTPVQHVPGRFLKGRALRRLRDDYEMLARSHVAAATLRFDTFGDLVATTRAGVRLLLGDDADLAQTGPLIDPILSQVAQAGRRIAAVDLRAPRTPVVVYRQK